MFAKRCLPLLIAFIVIGTSFSDWNAASCQDQATIVQATNQATTKIEREFYDLRIYVIESADNQKLALDYLKETYLPSLKGLSINQVGVFVVQPTEAQKDSTTSDAAQQPATDFSIFVLVPYPDMNSYAEVQDAIQTQIEQQCKSSDKSLKAFQAYNERNLNEPIFSRIESRLLRAFSGMPVIEQPEYSIKHTSRLFELRLYESHTEEFASRKIRMFNEGEIQLMRDVEMAPVFFGETLIGPDVPNLVYMLSAESKELHQQHWKAFIAHPEWDRMKNLEEFKDTVSKIRNWFLIPTEFSDF